MTGKDHERSTTAVGYSTGYFFRETSIKMHKQRNNCQMVIKNILIKT